MSNPFTYINDVSFDKKDIIRQAADPEYEARGYNPWITNKTLSYFQDTIMYSNEMNKYAFLPNIMQFDYFFNSINRRKRFAKQTKKIVSDDVQAVATYFKYSLRRAEETIKFLTPDQIRHIREKTTIGGM